MRRGLKQAAGIEEVVPLRDLPAADAIDRGPAPLWRRLTRALGRSVWRVAAPHLHRLLDDTPPRERLEALADRMWELQESEERSRDLVDALGDLVVHRDREGRIVYANRVFADLLNTDMRDLMGRTLEELGIRVRPLPDAAFARTPGHLTSADVAIETPGRTRWFSWIELSAREPGGTRVTRQAIAREITLRKQAEAALIAARERAEIASQAKSRFLATVSHEIRTPMNGILGMTKLLADTELSPEQRTYLTAVSTSAGSLVALIEDLLAFSKIEAGRFSLEPQPMSPRELADGVAELMAPRAYARSIGMGCFVAPDVPETVEADPGRLRQVLLNLVGNAVKFTESGGVRLAVTRDGPNSLRFCVRDTGPGLKPEDRQRVFEEFEQGDGTTTRAHGGTGLGLAISRRIVAAMGGTIGVEPEPGGGSCFFFTLPIAPPPDTDGQPPPQPLAGRSILMISRNCAEAQALAETIRAYGGHAVIAPSPADAEGEGHACDTLIVDAALETPDGSLLQCLARKGFGARRALIAIAPEQRGTLAEFRSAGYRGFLARPIRGATLIKTILAEALPPPAKSSPPSRRKRRASAETRMLNVLVAEDNAVNALLVRAALSRAGHAVEVVDNGREALERLTAPEPHGFHCVLMDLHMPQMDGLDALRMVRRHEDASGLAPVPILMLSADGQEATRHRALSLGANGFALKPLDPDALLSLVEAEGA